PYNVSSRPLYPPFRPAVPTVSVQHWLQAAPDAPCATCPPAAMRSDSRDLELINQLIETDDSQSRMSITGPMDYQPPPSPMQLIDDPYSTVASSAAGAAVASGSAIPNQQPQQQQQQLLMRQLVVSSPSFFGPGLTVTSSGAATSSAGRISSVTSELLTPRTQEFVFNVLGRTDMEIDLDN
uniref:TORC_C domain-containing protein n=1 Tax=Macrostomum lignano TaxID=282301 RepID=A0A1I8FVX2_9PLAT